MKRRLGGARAIAALGDATLPLSPAEYGRLIVDETAKWAKGHQNQQHQDTVGRKQGRLGMATGSARSAPHHDCRNATVGVMEMATTEPV